MEKIFILSGVTAITLAANADISITLPAGESRTQIQVEKGLISAIANQKRGETVSEIEMIPVVNGVAVIKTLSEGPAQYVISTGEREGIVIYSLPDDTINISISNMSPAQYSVSGSTLMEAIAGMDARAKQVLEAFRAEQVKPDADTAKLEQLEQDFYNVFTGYAASNPDSPAVAYAVMNLDSEKFMDAYNGMSASARQSPLMPYVEAQKKYVEKTLEAERRMVQLQSGNVDAPNFTFRDRAGKDISLSDFKGKWVIIDFWGSWCRWCIKGIPEMKATYEKYKPELEIIGIACNDSREAWENALDKYKLPWVNLYNPEQGGGNILQEYGVQGFPTKVIVSPEGKIKNITSGENPAFYELLGRLLSK